MKILIVSQWFIYKSPTGIVVPGGTERYSYRLAKQLQKGGHEVMVLSTAMNKNEAGFEILDGIDIYRFKEPPIKVYSYSIDFLSFLNTLKMIKKFNPDIIHVNTCGFRFALGSILALKILRKNVLYRSGAHPPSRTLSHRFYNSVAGKVIGRVEIVITPSTELKTVLACQINPEKIEVIPNFTTKSYYRKTKKENNSLLFVGRLYDDKGIDLLIHALLLVREEIPDVKLHLCGDGESRNHLKRLTSELGLEKEVLFHGHVDDDVLANMYSKCEVFVFPSLIEGCPNVLMEAMSAGIPIIAYDLDCISEILEGEKFGMLVKRGSIKELAEQIISLLKDDKLREYYSIMSMKGSANYTRASDNSINIIYNRIMSEKLLMT